MYRYGSGTATPKYVSVTSRTGATGGGFASRKRGCRDCRENECERRRRRSGEVRIRGHGRESAISDREERAIIPRRECAPRSVRGLRVVPMPRIMGG